MPDAPDPTVVVPCFDAAPHLPTTLASADRNTLRTAGRRRLGR